MKTLWTIIIIVVVLGLWYWLAHRGASYAPTASTTPVTELGVNGSPNQTNTGMASSTPLLSVSNTAKLGNFLVATNGMTLYRYTKDTAGVSNCTGSCATIWPPYIVGANEPLTVADMTMATGTLSTLTRSDGQMQLTYNGIPLYYYQKDVNPGDTKGQGVGGVWFVVKP